MANVRSACSHDLHVETCLHAHSFHLSAVAGLVARMSTFSEDLDSDVAEPFRFHFEVAYEVANKGT